VRIGKRPSLHGGKTSFPLLDSYSVSADPESMPHKIEVFSADCPLCNRVVDEIEVGKCAGCQLIVYNLSENFELARSYRVRVVPTVIIDGDIKIEGRPDIPFVCSEEIYDHFKERYPLTVQLTRSSNEAHSTSQPTQN
jgi:thioredoxin family protein